MSKNISYLLGGERRVFNRMSVIGTILWCMGLGCFRMHKDGNSFSGYLRPWNPLSWVVYVAMIVPCAFIGEKISEVVPMRLSKFWRENSDQLQWVTPLTRLDSLKPFRFKPSPTPVSDENQA